MPDHNHYAKVGDAVVMYDWSGLTSVCVCDHCEWRALGFDFNASRATAYAHARSHSVCVMQDCERTQAAGRGGLCNECRKSVAA